MQKKVGMIVMTAVGSCLRTVGLHKLQVNPTDATDISITNLIYNHSIVMNSNLKVNLMDHYLSPLILTDSICYHICMEGGGGGSAFHIRLLCLKINAPFRNSIRAEAQSEAGNNSLPRENTRVLAGWHLKRRFDDVSGVEIDVWGLHRETGDQKQWV